MATREQLQQALVQAHQAGDTRAAELFAGKIKGNDFDGGSPYAEGNAPGRIATGAAHAIDAGGFGLSRHINAAGSIIGDMLGIGPQSNQVQLTDSAKARGRQMGLDIPEDKSVGERYLDYRDDFAGRLDAAAQENPKSAVTGSVVGGLATGGAIGAKALANLSPGKLNAAKGLLGVGAAEGAAIGGTTSDAREFGDFAGDVGQSSAIGGALGIAAPAATNAAIGTVRRIFDRGGVAQDKAQQKAYDAIEELLADEGRTLDDLDELLGDNQNLIPADVSENLRFQLGALSQRPGSTPQAARDQLTERTTGQADRFVKTFREELGDTPVAEAATAVVQRTRTEAGPLYERAYEMVIPPQAQTRLRALIERDRGAMNSAARLLRRRGEDIDLDGPLNVRTVDKITSYLGGRGRASRSRGDAQEGASFEKLRQDIIDTLDPIAPTLRNARRIAADQFADDDAMQLGQKVFTDDIVDVKNIVKDMSTSELEHFRLGVFAQVRKKIGRKGDQADVSKLFSSPDAREAVRVAFGSMDKFRKFMRQVDDEGAMFRTMSEAIGGSQTAKRMAFGDPGQVPESLTQAMGQQIQNANQALRAPSIQANRNAMGQMLLGQQPIAPVRPNLPGQATGALAAPAAIDPQQQLDLLLNPGGQ